MTGEHVEDEVRRDDLELEAAGYKAAMPRQFSLSSLGALSFTLTCTWLGTGSSIAIPLLEASAAGTLWSLPIAGVMTLISSAGMAELASAFPVAGAQYYWAYMVSSEPYKPFASYMNAWLSIIGWWLGSASVSNFVASMILDIALLWYPDYVYHSWHQYLLYVLLIWIAMAVNVFASRWIPQFNHFIFILSALTLGATAIALFITARNNHASAQWIFTDTTNLSGWSSDGWAFMLAVGNAVYAYLGSDCGAHMCEEIPNPGRNVPMVILFPLAMGLITAFPFCVALLYAISDLEAVLTTPTGLPLLEIYYQGTGSMAGASVLMALFAFCFWGCLVATLTTCSRTLWSVCRDGALPYSDVWAHVHPYFEMPVNAIVLSGTLVSIYGVIFLGSTTAFSAMVSAAILFQQTSAILPQAIMLYRGRDKVLPERYFNLGKFGPYVNATAVLWVVFLDILYCFPTTLPVTPQNMSWVSVVAVGLTGIIVIIWFVSKGQTFKGPTIDYDLLNARRHAAIEGVEDMAIVQVAADESLSKRAD